MTTPNEERINYLKTKIATLNNEIIELQRELNAREKVACSSTCTHYRNDYYPEMPNYWGYPREKDEDGENDNIGSHI